MPTLHYCKVGIYYIFNIRTMIDRLQKDNRWITYLIYILIRKAGNSERNSPLMGL